MNLFKKLSIVICLSLLIISCCSANGEKITMKNIEQFKSELNQELAAGSSKEKVERYLKDLKLEHSYAESEKKFYAIVRKVGRYRIIYESNLLIRIQLNTENLVEKIDYEIERSGL